MFQKNMRFIKKHTKNDKKSNLLRASSKSSVLLPKIKPNP